VNLIYGAIIFVLALVTILCGLHTTRLRLAFSDAMEKIRWLECHFAESQAALQTALGGGWQLADPDKDVFLLPESAVAEFTDTLSGGIRELYRRSATVLMLMDDDLMRRVLEADWQGLPVSFRGLEWRLAQVSHPRCGGGYLGAQTIEGLYHTSLELVTSAAR
jgi:hypothetical protein